CGGQAHGATASQDSPSARSDWFEGYFWIRAVAEQNLPRRMPPRKYGRRLAHRSQNGPFSPRAAKWATSSSFDGRTYSSFRRSRYRGTLSACVCPIVRAAPSGPGFASRQSSMWDVPRKKTMWFEHVFRMSFHHCAAGRDRYTRVSRGEAVARPFARVIAIDSAQ